MPLFGPPNVEKLKAKRDIPGLAKVLAHSKDLGVRIAAADALGDTGDTLAFPPLAAELVAQLTGVGQLTGRQQSDSVRLHVVMALGKLRAKPAVGPLITLLRHEWDVMRAVSAWALGEIGDPAATEPLLRALADPDIGVRAAAARALIQIRDPHAVELLNLAGSVLTGIDPRAIPLLTAALADPDEYVRQAAGELLTVMGAPATPPAAAAGPPAAPPEPAAEPWRAAFGGQPPAAVFAALASDEHPARQQAIAALLATGYQDPQETRTFEILGREAGEPCSQDQINEDIAKFPDFETAYIWAANPTGNSDDHTNADVSRFPEGLMKCKTRAALLASLSGHATWQGDWLKALDCAVAAVAIGDPSEGPGDMVQVAWLLAGAFGKAGLESDAALALKAKAPYRLGPRSAADVERAAAALASQHADDVRWAADTVRQKLQDTLRAKEGEGLRSLSA